jgi:rhodanese-related sulfurtransferase
MAGAPRITVEELKRRMETGEDFTVVDVRNPTAWAESDTMLPEAIRLAETRFDSIQIGTWSLWFFRCFLS